MSFILNFQICSFMVEKGTYLVPFHFNKQKSQKALISLTSDSLEAGDERIELPPKVLETPIIPFDQSPTKYILYTLKTTYMLTFP